MKSNQTLPQCYTAQNGRRVCKSRTHKDMYIVEMENGKWFSITSNDAVMRTSHPPKTSNQMIDMENKRK